MDVNVYTDKTRGELITLAGLRRLLWNYDARSARASFRTIFLEMKFKGWLEEEESCLYVYSRMFAKNLSRKSLRNLGVIRPFYSRRFFSLAEESTSN